MVPSGAEEATSSVAIDFEGVRISSGSLFIAIFDNENDWLKRPVRSYIMEIDKLDCSWTVDDLPNGAYGLAVFHDVNSNGKNDTNFLGIPKEPWGVSNDVRRRLGPPRWSQAQFLVRSDTTFTIGLK